MRIHCPGTIVLTNEFSSPKSFRKSLSAICCLIVLSPVLPKPDVPSDDLGYVIMGTIVMLHGVTRTSAALFLLAGFGLTPAAAAPVSVTGSTAVAVAGVIARYSPLLSAHEKRAIAALFNGRARAGNKLTVTAGSITCRVSNVDIIMRSCEMTFDKGTRTLKGREANEVNATLTAAGAIAEGAAGSMIQTVTKLICTLDPNVIKDNSGGGADCSFATDQ
ncbi:MAG TPA: hypothetical protein VF396_24320 [Bradyrhizobium sp.]